MKLSEVKQTVYYHGTARDDATFLGLGQHWRGGIYFTHDYKGAVDHAKMDASVEGGTAKVIHAHLTITNPKHVEGIESHEYTHDQIRAMMKDGYDSVINGGETIVFDTHQIKVLKVEILRTKPA